MPDWNSMTGKQPVDIQVRQMFDRTGQRRPVPSRKVIPAETAVGEHRIPADQCPFILLEKADTPGGVTGGMDYKEVPDPVAVR
jgi:hypothetical protein